MKQQTMGQLVLTNGVRWAMTEYGMDIEQATEIVEAEGKKVCINCETIVNELDSDDVCAACPKIPNCEHCE